MTVPLQDASARETPDVPALVDVGSRTLRNTALVLSARVVSRVLALVVVMLMNRHLDAGQFGVYSTVVAISGVVTVVMDVGFNTLFQREAARDPGLLSRYLSNLASARLFFAVLALGILAAALQVEGLLPYLAAGFVMMLLASYSNLLRGGLYAVQRLKLEALAIVLESAILLGAVFAGVLTRQGPGYYLWAYAASYAFDCVFFLVVLHARRIARLTWHLDPGFVRRWFWLGLPFALTLVITSIYFNIDQPMVTFFKGPTETGWYSSGYKLFASVLFLPQTMLQVVFPVLSVMHRERDARLTRTVERFYKGLLLFGWPITVGCVLLSPAFRFVYQYGPAEPAFQILSLGMVFMFVTNAFIGALNSIDRQVSFTWAAFWSMVFNVGVNLAIIPRFGYLGASWSTVATEFVLCVLGWWLTARHLAAVPVHRLSWRILLAGVVMGAAIFPFRSVTGFPAIGVIAGGAVVYALAIVLVRALDRDDWAQVRRVAPFLPLGR